MKLMRVNNLTLILATILISLSLVLFGQSRVLISPSHPFVDSNNNGIDDFEEIKDKEIEDNAKRFNVSFPIADLNNCKDYSDCRALCEDPVNESVCIAFAKSKGFYEEEPVQRKVAVILRAAQRELGCQNEKECMDYCSQSSNYDKCHDFATKQGLVGGYSTDPRQAPVLEKAKQVLGCDSYEGCKSYCEGNKDKCDAFAKSVGLRGGEEPKGPGGCRTPATCGTFCQDPKNFQECSKFNQGGEFKGPGGCSSEGSCRDYCQTNPQSCKSIVGGAIEYRPVGNYGSPEEFAKHCIDSPEKCLSVKSGSPEDEYMKFCRENPDKCRPREDVYNHYVKCPPEYYVGPSGACTPLNKSSDAYTCSSQPGKYWDGSTCKDYSVNSYYSDPASACARTGCAWIGSTCTCSQYTYDPERMCTQSGCSWSNNSCNCSSGGSSGIYGTPYGGNYTPGPYYTPGTYSYPTPGSAYSYPTPYSGSPGSCSEPSGGCPSGWYWNAPACSCNPTAGNYPTPGGANCSQPSGGCPSGWTWVSSACSCNYTGGGTYSYPTPYSYATPGYYSYPTPYSGGYYSYPTPYSGSYSYPTPYSYSYPTPYSGTYSYPTPYSYQYPTPQAYSYPTPQSYSYPTPQTYSYPTPQSYSYPSPYSYPTPSGVQGVKRTPNVWESAMDWLLGR